MTEICVDVKTPLNEIKNMLSLKGFSFVETYDSFDAYYTKFSNSEIKKLTYKELLDSSVLVRNVIDKENNFKCLVHKKKTLDSLGNVISEIKTEVKIDSIENSKKLFSNIGLTCWCEINTQNNEFRKDELVINVQNVEALGSFIEIEEFESIKNKNNEEKFNILKDIANSFGFELGNDYSCKKSYMFLQKLLHS